MTDPGILLSRLQITGELTPSTPKIVITEIVNAHGIYCDFKHLNSLEDYDSSVAKIINEIYETPIINITKDSYKKSYPAIARFINNSTNWDAKSLCESFNFIKQYFNNNNFDEIPENPKFGLQTPKECYNLNACVLYGYCRYHQIKTNFNTTIEQMASYLNYLRLPKKELRSLITSDLSKIKIKSRLINIFIECLQKEVRNIEIEEIDDEKKKLDIDTPVSKSNEIEDIFNINYEECALIANNINNNTIVKLKDPSTHSEAIAIAAIYYLIDITQVANPLKEYQALKRKPYIPHHKTMRDRLMSIHEDTESPYLNKCFNPYLPKELYTEETLRQLLLNEGYTMEEANGRNKYEILQITVLSDTFYHGKYANIKNTETVVTLDSINDLEHDSIVCYGVRGEKMTAFTYEELKMSFENCLNFQNLIDGIAGQFSDIAIKKLTQLTCRPKYVLESDHSYQIRTELFNMIMSIKKLVNITFSQYRNFLDIYRSAKIHIRDQIKVVITSLHHMAMYMRGWNGVGQLPIANAPILNQADVDIRSSESIVNFEKECDALGNLSRTILDLPLLKYKSSRFIASSDASDGLTIRDRLNIVKYDNGNVSSCIRLSSNWFASTSYYLMQMLGMKLDYQIFSLDHIA